MLIQSKYYFSSFIIFLIVLISKGNGLPDIVKIGVLFDNANEIEEVAFRHAIERVNLNNNVLPRSRIVPFIEKLPLSDSFHASKKICQLLTEGLAGIFGTQTPQSASYIQSVCEVLQIPHFETKWNFRRKPHSFLLNLYPRPSSLARAYADLLNAWEWDKYVIIYENNESLVRLQEIFKASFPVEREATVKQLPAGDDYRPLFKEIRMHTDITNIIIDCDISKLEHVFEHAMEVGMMNVYFKYFVTNLDLHTIDLERFQESDTNITAFRMVDPSRPEVLSTLGSWQALQIYGFQNRSYMPSIYVDESLYGRSRNYNFQFQNQAKRQDIPSLPNNMLPMEVALIYDAIELFTRALHVLYSNGQTAQISSFKPLSCNSPQDIFQFGRTLIDSLNKIEFEGLTGILRFDQEGYRSGVALEVIELTRKGLSKIGIWNEDNSDKFTWTRTAEETLKQQEADLKNKTLIVTTKLSAPYCMDPYNNGSFEGYGIDIIDLIAEHFEFNYEIRLVKDNKYGNPDNSTKFGWNGMIGEILEGVADIAIGDMTINYDRERTVDFTMPFMNMGISILHKKPKKNPPSLFSFLEPFNFDVWIYMATAYLGVSMILFILARISPFEWQELPPCSPDAGKILENPFNLVGALWFCCGSLLGQGCDFLPKLSPAQWVNPHPCVSNPEELENDLNLPNCLWHNWGSLMQQGSDIAPKAGSTRMVAGIWWFFSLILISSYTANLAAFLTKEGMEAGVNDVTDLPKQTKVKYGCLSSGSTAAFFKDSTFPLYKEIWTNMVNMKPSPMVESTKEGMERVDKSDGDYCFFMESSSIEYVTERNCELTQIGGLLDSKGYGIALRKYSKYREAFSGKVLELQERGKLEELKVKWWKEKGGGICQAEVVASGGAQALTLAHVGGVFVVLMGGCGVASIMAMLEFLWKSRKMARNENESIFAEMWNEFKFAINCNKAKKPVKKSSSESLDSVPYSGLNRKTSNENES